MLQALFSLNGDGHLAPPFFGCVVIERVRREVPLAQVLEHDPQLPQFDTTQFTGQGFVLHALEAFSVGHALPPFLTCVVIVRLRFCVPEPQALVQPPHDCHEETAQSMGQAFVLHAAVVLVFSHFLPPFAAFCAIVRVLDLVPLPHVLEHFPHADHAECLQLTGQAFVLHTAFIERLGHLRPPSFGWVLTVRVRGWMPPPQSLLHLPYAAHALTTQWTGQPRVLHFCVFFRGCGHALPPYAFATSTLRVVVCVPPPQVLEHDGQPAHDATTQSTGQCFELQTLVPESDGHVSPPFFAAWLTDLFRVALPPAHVLLHDDHAPQLFTLQSTGHGDLLQLPVSASFGQTSMLVALGVIVRLRVRLPPPHVLLHALHFDQDVTGQMDSVPLILAALFMLAATLAPPAGSHCAHCCATTPECRTHIGAHVYTHVCTHG